MKITRIRKHVQNLTTLLEEALRKGEVRIRRRDGESFVLRPERPGRSPSMLKVWISVSRVNRSSAQFTRVERSKPAC